MNEPTDTEILDWIQRSPEIVIESVSGMATGAQHIWKVKPVDVRSRDLRTVLKQAMRLRP